MSDTAIENLSHFIEAEFSFVRQETEPEVDGIFQKIHETSEGVTQGMGQDWKVIHTFSTGVAGAFRNIGALGPASASSSSTGQSHMWGSTIRTFPSLRDETQPGSVQKTIQLVQGMGTLSVPFHWLMADKLPSSIASQVDLLIRGTAKNVNQAEANSFYLNDAVEKPLAVIEDITAIDSNPSQTMVFDMSDSTKITGRIARFLPGMTVTGMDTSLSPDAALTNASVGIVTKVYYTEKKFSVWWRDGSPTFVNGDYLALAKSEVTSAGTGVLGPAGAETWLSKSESTAVFGLDFSTHPQFKSIVEAVSGVMDEGVLNKFIGGFYDAYGGMYSLDSIVTTTGVLVAYMESIDGLYRFQRQGQALKVMEGWSSIGYEWNGQNFEILASRYQAPGQAYILKLGEQNLKRYVPPPLMSAKTRKEFPRDVRFTAPFQGSSNIFLPGTHVSTTGAEGAASAVELTEFARAPFIYLRQWCPAQLNGILLTGITESNPTINS